MTPSAVIAFRLALDNAGWNNSNGFPAIIVTKPLYDELLSSLCSSYARGLDGHKPSISQEKGHFTFDGITVIDESRLPH